MSGGGNGSGSPERGKDGRFKPGSSGNPLGRRPNRRRLGVTGQILRDVIAIVDQEITVDGPDGPRTISKGELLLERVFALAVKGNPTATNNFMKWWNLALEERMQRHPNVRLAELFRELYENPTGDRDPAYLAAMDVWAKRLKHL